MPGVSHEKDVARSHPSRRGCSGTGGSSQLFLRLTPERMLILLAALIFIAEVFTMFLLDLLPPLTQYWDALLDSTVLLFVLSPVYFFLYRPFWLERQRREDEVRHLSRQLLHAEEMTRTRVARDLHDEFGQGLTALQLGIETLKNSLPLSQGKELALCRRLSEMIAQLGKHVRSMTTELRPSMLDNLGLVPTLRWLSQQFSERYSGISVDLQVVDESERLAPEIEIALYRVCQESLNNVAKHANARLVRITMIRTKKLLTLAIVDDGNGFDTELCYATAKDHQKYGLLGMRERIAELGGTFSVISTPAEGTSVRVQLSLANEEKE
ncbi:MAG: sensor histidine kinase [Desulfuromonadales bacterium]|nr:sensor histidine kinase [Desulfuromonadales bacterium]